MSIKPNKVIFTDTEKPKTGKNKNKKLKINLEGIQICIQNAERLRLDSQNVSPPTEMALLELGLEEISKAWILLMRFETQSFLTNSVLLSRFLDIAHIDETKFKEIVEENRTEIEKYILSSSLESFITPFDSHSFTDHKAKINYLSNLVGYIKKISLSTVQQSQNREEFAKDILGKFIGEIDIESMDETISEALNINEDQLGELISIKEKGIYVDIEGGYLISPSSRNYFPKVLINLLVLLIATCKNELITLSKALETY